MADTNIHIADDVKAKILGDIKEDSFRWMKLSIVKEDINIGATHPLGDDFDGEYEKMSENVKKKESCYFLLRLADKPKYVIIMYIPTDTKVKNKMMYSSTLYNVKKDIGTSVVGNWRATELKDLKAGGFGWINKEKLFESKEEKEEYQTEEERMLASEEVSYSSGSGSSGSTISFPVTPELLEKMKGFAKGSEKIVIIKLNTKKEEIILDKTVDSQDDLQNLIPRKNPSFTFINYDHEKDGKKTAVIFIYSSPSKSKVKDRMLYSSSKGNVLTKAFDLGIKVTKSLETSDPKEINDEFLMDELYPKKFEEKVKFQRIRVKRRRPKKKIL